MKNFDLLPISVIIPCYNSSKTIIRALNSVINQSKPPKQVIIIDDFSEDRDLTLDLLNRFEHNINIEITILLNDKNFGPGYSRNRGWNISKHKYIAFLDADDIWHPDKINVQYEWMTVNPNVILSSHKSEIFNNLNQLTNFKNSFAIKKASPYNMLWSNPFSTRCIMLKKNILNRFPNNSYYAEDYLLWSQLVCANPNSCYILDTNLAFSFKNEDSSHRLSNNLYSMEKSELLVLKFICETMGYSILIKYIAYLYSIIRFLKRATIKFFN